MFENGAVLTITYDRLLEIDFPNPEFGYYFLRLSTERLLQNIARLEGSIARARSSCKLILQKTRSEGQPRLQLAGKRSTRCSRLSNLQATAAGGARTQNWHHIPTIAGALHNTPVIGSDGGINLIAS